MDPFEQPSPRIAAARASTQRGPTTGTSATAEPIPVQRPCLYSAYTAPLHAAEQRESVCVVYFACWHGAASQRRCVGMRVLLRNETIAALLCVSSA